ncbi:programmed cell death protein 2-like [Epargyreus clarus]|uniref:programmed cell death protein 2-like n=1 Tax=Epargyreus clarus TaxID=520877 RepID=UPI003C2BDB30
MSKEMQVFLGYENGILEGRSNSTINYTCDKIGGFPDWPPLKNIEFSTKCPLCGLHRLLVVQCYAPMTSLYHRTLYVFACINPNCWNQSESWTCIRCQLEDEHPYLPPSPVAMQSSDLNWCQGSDDWDENENGNNFMSMDNSPSPNNVPQRISDDDEDESNSFDVETMQEALGNLQVFDATNANNFPAQGAVGVPVAVAEIEGKDDSDLVTVDTPTVPTKNIEALFQQTAELPPDIRSRLNCNPLQFVPKHIYIEEETKSKQCHDEKVMELLNKYKQENDMDVSNAAGAACAGAGDDELYEEAAPLHGDRMFHAFLTRLRRNPTQILRYSRDVPPLLGAPLTAADNIPPHCWRCRSKLICEIQLLPRYADSLLLAPDNMSLPYLHFLSVLIFTCSQSCWVASDKVFKETVIFQPEI